MTPGPPGRALGFRRHLRAEVKAGRGAYLFSERGVIALRGSHVESLAAVLDGSRELADLVRERPGGMPPGQLAAVLAQLVDAGLVAIREQGEREVDEQALAYWDACGIDGEAVAERGRTAAVRLLVVGDEVDAEPVERALADARLGLAGAAADLSVVLCADYLDPRLAEIDAEHRRDRRPWLLARPFGAQVWIGPVFRPDGACWHCLAHRLWGHRHAEACVQELLGHSGPARRPVSALPPLTSAAAHLISLEVCKWLAGYRYRGQQSVWTLDTLDLHGRLHELRRRPQCAACGDSGLVAALADRPVVLSPAPKAASGGGGHRTATPAEVLAGHRHLVSPVTGIIKAIEPDPAAPPFVNAFRSGFNVAHGITGMEAFKAGMRYENGGKGTTPLDAEVGALCEGVERFSGNYQGDERRVRASYAELGAEAVHPNECMLFADRQYAERAGWNRRHAAFQQVCDPFDVLAELDWTPLWTLSGEKRHLPTGLLYFGAPAEGGPVVCADSNGNAAGSSREDAILQATLELIERDAVALWWYNRTPLPGVDVLSLEDPWLVELLGQYASIGRELWLLDLTSDFGIPVMAALSRRVDGPPEHIVFGFGAHFDPRIAARRAATELNQLLPMVLECGHELDDPDARRWLEHATVANQPYLRPRPGVRASVAADFGYVHRADIRDDITALRKMLGAQGLEMLVLDQTRPDIGLPVVKVVVPGLRPFWARFAPGRLFTVPVRLGRLAGPTPYDQLNPFPMFL
ncbi:TOMM precursor leader peptide-binding protein [Amycolatopsis sp. NBC_01480]|uniref:TOMM precursor leader peptide-binding protein n=1 Tax=Amycolatopsis sp. NBC_01480 TaxID=2903562 RepID=UPI002E2D7CBC|nr:TOMM precursor leader peptide-binding protein [Amycolatopsis sp. NBC_01480]